MSGITDKIRNAAKSKPEEAPKTDPKPKASEKAPKASKPKPKPKAAPKPKAKPKAPKKASKPKPKTAPKPKAKKAAKKAPPNPKGVHPEPIPFNKSVRDFSKVYLADLIREACAAMGVSHAELARRLEISGPRIPEILRSENITEGLASRCFGALGVDLEIRMVKREG